MSSTGRGRNGELCQPDTLPSVKRISEGPYSQRSAERNSGGPAIRSASEASRPSRSCGVGVPMAVKRGNGAGMSLLGSATSSSAGALSAGRDCGQRTTSAAATTRAVIAQRPGPRRTGGTVRWGVSRGEGRRPCRCAKACRRWNAALTSASSRSACGPLRSGCRVDTALRHAGLRVSGDAPGDRPSRIRSSRSEWGRVTAQRVKNCDVNLRIGLRQRIITPSPQHVRAPGSWPVAPRTPKEQGIPC